MRVARVVPVTLQSPVPVYDIEVPKHSNFLLHGASYVHNSKDVADAVCGAYTTLIQRRSSWRDAAADDEANAASLRADFEDRLDEPRPD